MNKKLYVIILMFCFLLIGCGKNSLESPNDQTPPINSSEAPTQPILFDNIKDVINFFTSKDVKEYSLEDQKVYFESLNVLSADGHLVIPKSNSAKQVYGITFYPKTKNEDAGLGFWFEHNKELYQVIIYEFDKNIINRVSEINIKDYKRERFGIDTKNENLIEHKINGISINLMIAEFGLDNNKKNVVSFTPLENKYIEIKSSTSTDNIINFLNSLNYESINLN